MLSFAMTPGAHAAGDKPYVMKISIATVGEAQHQFAKDYAAAIEKDSGGRIKTEIYPASQLGSSSSRPKASNSARSSARSFRRSSSPASMSASSS